MNEPDFSPAFQQLRSNRASRHKGWMRFAMISQPGNRINENVRVEWATRLHSLEYEGELIVTPGQYFVLGDNRDQSLDSRYWGFVPPRKHHRPSRVDLLQHCPG